MLDLSLNSNIIINSKLECAIQELDIIFNTENTELIGYPRFGTNFEQFLWALTPTTTELKKYIIEKILETNYLKNLNYEVNVKTLNGEYRLIYIVDINIKDDEGNEENKTYQFR